MKNRKLLILIIMRISTNFLHGQEISANFPFESKYQDLGDARMHYIDTGKGDPILFLHGVPMSSYSWRNIIPHVSDKARCIAIDFMGFGKSDKPAINYSFDDQYKYLSDFIDSLGLNNITLVMTDIGGILGQKYAWLNQENVKGLVLMETPLTNAELFHKNAGNMQRMMFWMAGKEKMGYKMFVKKNMFVKLMPKLIKRKLSKEEKGNYAEPFKTEASRIPMYASAHAFPKKGKNVQNGDMGDYLNINSKWLMKSEHPKLLITAKPGMLVNKKVTEWAKENLKNLDIIEAGKAKHLMEEDLPHEIGDILRNWYLKIKVIVLHPKSNYLSLYNRINTV